VGKDSKKSNREESIEYGPETIEQRMRERVRDFIELIVEEELEHALGAPAWERVGAGRRGYRHGHRNRQLTTSLGPTTFRLPRARLQQGEGRSSEWHSEMFGRYERRTERVNEGILGVYLSGANSRRIKGALAPLLRGGPLSKDAVSRLVARLKEEFEQWQERDLAKDDIRYLVFDGWYPKVRIGRERARVPVLVTLGVRGDGERIVLDIRVAGQETAAAWADVVDSLLKRHVGKPRVALIDGNPGLHEALRAQWPKLPIQRCTAHKLRNLQAKVPKGLREEVAEDYRRMVYAEDRAAVEQQRRAFRAKWQKKCAAVITSLDEAGEELFTFLDFPQSQWRALRTTNALERINEEFRRRTKTQGMLPSEDAVVLLLFGLLRSGQIRLRRLDGWEDLAGTRTVMAEAA